MILTKGGKAKFCFRPQTHTLKASKYAFDVSRLHRGAEPELAHALAHEVLIADNHGLLEDRSFRQRVAAIAKLAAIDRVEDIRRMNERVQLAFVIEVTQMQVAVLRWRREKGSQLLRLFRRVRVPENLANNGKKIMTTVGHPNNIQEIHDAFVRSQGPELEDDRPPSGSRL